MTRKDLICYGKIITKIFCGLFFSLLFLLLVIKEFLLFFGGNPSFMSKIREDFFSLSFYFFKKFLFSFCVLGLILWFVAWMELNQALKSVATHGQE